jgi:seryl-tRNA synthetase
MHDSEAAREEFQNMQALEERSNNYGETTNQLKAELNQLKAELNQLKAELNQLKAELNERDAERTAVIAELHNLLDEFVATGSLPDKVKTNLCLSEDDEVNPEKLSPAEKLYQRVMSLIGDPEGAQAFNQWVAQKARLNTARSAMN